MNNTAIIENEQKETIQPKYTFRTLNSTDVFLMFRILSKIGINEFAESLNIDTMQTMLSTVKNDDKNASVASLGGISFLLNIANVVMCNIPKCETEIYQMLSNTSNLTVDEVRALDMVTFSEMVIDFIKKDEFKDFILVVSRLFKSAN